MQSKDEVLGCLITNGNFVAAYKLFVILRWVKVITVCQAHLLKNKFRVLKNSKAI